MLIIMVVIDSEVEDTTKRRLQSPLTRPQALCGLFATTVSQRGRNTNTNQTNFTTWNVQKDANTNVNLMIETNWLLSSQLKDSFVYFFSGKDTQLPSHPPNDGCPTSWKSSGEKTQRTQFATSPLKLLLIIAESEAKSDNVKKKQNRKISCSHIIY